MLILINWISSLMLENDLVSEEDLPWLKYGLEKRITTIIVTIPFLLIGMFISNFMVTISFYITLYILRTRINGYHANSFKSCVLHSLLTEVLLLCLIYPILNDLLMITSAILGVIVVFRLAPYNHANMHLSEAEIVACKASSRFRVCIFWVLLIVAIVLGYEEIAKGISLGTIMVVYLLVLAYIFDGGKYEKD